MPYAPSVTVGDRGGEVAARVEDLGVGGAQHRLAHLLDDGLEAVLHHGHGDGIDAIAHGTSPPVRDLGPVPTAAHLT